MSDLSNSWAAYKAAMDEVAAAKDELARLENGQRGKPA